MNGDRSNSKVQNYLEPLKHLAKQMAPGGNMIFLACHASEDDGYKFHVSTTLGNFLFKDNNVDFNIYMNRD